MNKILARCIVVSLCLLAVVVFSAALALNTGTNESETETVTSEKAAALYLLSEYNGKIALYKSGYSMPVEIFDVYVSSLPESEREIISEGIAADSDEQAQRLIEDYTS